jgi:hypothetical protein
MSYGIIRVKNIDNVDGVYEGQLIPVGEIYTVPDTDRPRWMTSDNVYNAIANDKIQIGDSSIFYTDKTQQWSIILDNVEMGISALPAFAKPDYRTKNDAISEPVTIAPNSSENIDFLLTEERYVSGGEMIIENAVFGDYVTAEVYDLSNVIPEAYRNSLCENHPTVSKYILKRYVVPANAQGYSFCQLDTRPLTAKITAGLYLRITYYSINSGTDRRILVNNHLTKKL